MHGHLNVKNMCYRVSVHLFPHKIQKYENHFNIMFYICFVLFSVALRANAGHGLLIF
jgi:hypothetical protein